MRPDPFQAPQRGAARRAAPTRPARCLPSPTAANHRLSPLSLLLFYYQLQHCVSLQRTDAFANALSIIQVSAECQSQDDEKHGAREASLRSAKSALRRPKPPGLTCADAAYSISHDLLRYPTTKPRAIYIIQYAHSSTYTYILSSLSEPSGWNHDAMLPTAT